MNNMKKTILALLIALVTLSAIACQGTGANNDSIFSTTVTFTVPADVANEISYGKMTVDEIKENATKNDYVFDSVQKDEDGSVTIVIKKSERKKAFEAMKNGFNSGVQELLAIGVFGHIKSMEVNDDFTTCTITTTSTAPAINDDALASFFFMSGAEYHSYEADPYKEIKAEFKNVDSGAVVNTILSKDYWQK
ncbi:MAG: hypothetical protein Q4F88_03225 [Eubacteriales bacterium]|nr:hypothetical protein [Eubacteriales bacterium]